MEKERGHTVYETCRCVEKRSKTFNHGFDKAISLLQCQIGSRLLLVRESACHSLWLRGKIHLRISTNSPIPRDHECGILGSPSVQKGHYGSNAKEVNKGIQRASHFHVLGNREGEYGTERLQ